MYIEHVPNRNSPPAILLRESYRDGKTVRKRTLANLSSLPAEVIEGLKALLRGGVAVPSLDDAFVIERSLPHGHVAAVLGAAHACGAEQWFASAPAALRSVVMALLVARVVSPASKLATHRMLCEQTATHSLSRLLKLGDVDLEQVYAALDWLGEAQQGIEKRLARQHLGGSMLVLYDLTSTWVTGRCCELAARGYSRDGKRDDPQIVFGLVCTPAGIPVAVEVFAGNTADPATVAPQVAKLKERYGIDQLAWVGDRGMLTQARIDTVLRPAGLDWASSLRAPQMAALAHEKGPFQPSLFDERNLLEVTSEAFPGERLIVCRNPLLAEERTRKREALLQATEAELMKIAEATTRARNRLKGTEAIALRVGRVIDHYKMAKHFELNITDSSFTWGRKSEQIQQEAALDGLYVVRTSLPAAALSAEAAVSAYKGLAVVERAFRSLKTVDLQVRPHVFLCMLAYYVEWHMREKLKPMLFDYEYVEQARAARPSPVAKARRSDQAKAKDATKLGEDGLPVHSFRTLLEDLATLAYNVCHTPLNPDARLVMTTRPTPVQEKAFRLLNVSPVACTQ
ncbi:IS1634 family transposase [Caballeronia sp. SEWSISQ10-4 2]|uniref:IS1634 family transposase n=1 Tax=Caballeronia sp. SEWSISQ10-4 2 TaxID=2937438 RepID=UPI0026558F7D|nr:IS1634 family transposase [Caballeronia sp. SEWSISQ10-4 2]MDN7184014.1 IS1634 family transposase [Caballeronia sp. SEWSISQ10-4 2]